MKTMQGNAQGLGMFRTVVGVTTIGVLLGACTSPTYGTGKTAAEQLVDDLGNATSITGDQSKRNLTFLHTRARRHHHGWQWPLGKAARTSARDGASPWG